MNFAPCQDVTQIDQALNQFKLSLQDEPGIHKYFVQAYLGVNQAVLDYYQDSDRTDNKLIDWEFYQLLSAEFANRYLIQLTRFVEGNKADEPWQTVFEKSLNYQDTGLAISAGLMAHIHFDLPMTLIGMEQSYFSTDRNLGNTQRAAYFAMDHVVASSLPNMVNAAFEMMQEHDQTNELTFKYGTIYKKLNARFRHLYITCVIVLIRREAWWHFHQLKSNVMSPEQLSCLTVKRINQLGSSGKAIDFFKMVLQNSLYIFRLGLGFLAQHRIGARAN
ncbi:MAG: DUF5995 family protein [Pseudomonadota bacterium]